MEKKIILFDFDGVIVDSFQAAFRVSKVVDRNITEESFRSLFNGNINDWKKGLSKEEVRRADEEFFGRYLPTLKQARVFPGMEKVIAELGKKYTLLIISSTISSQIRTFMERNKIAEHFNDIMGNDVHEDKTEKIKMIFEKHGARSENYVFITDTLGDMKEASKAGIISIGVSWGFQKKENLLKGKPFSIAGKPKELLRIISDYFKETQ